MFAILPFLCHGQELEQPKLAEYLVFTFKRNRKNGLHGKEYFYWVAPSNKEKQFNINDLQPLIMEDLSNESLRECQNQDSIHVYYKAQEDVPLNYGVRNKELQFLLGVLKKRKKIQRITKIWPSDLKETITVSVTPVVGVFYSCPVYSFESSKFEQFKKGVIILGGKCFLNEEHWKHLDSKRDLFMDFSTLNPEY